MKVLNLSKQQLLQASFHPKPETLSSTADALTLPAQGHVEHAAVHVPRPYEPDALNPQTHGGGSAMMMETGFGTWR